MMSVVEDNSVTHLWMDFLNGALYLCNMSFVNIYILELALRNLYKFKWKWSMNNPVFSFLVLTNAHLNNWVDSFISDILVSDKFN